MSNDNLQQAQIEYLEFPNNVRLRRGMYISSLNQMITEIVDNSVDESTAGNCSMIAVVIQNGLITVEDNGRGIPVGPSKKDPTIPQVELAFTTLHAGGKFGLANGYAKKTSGMNGVGGAAVQALSESMSIKIQTGGKKYEINFSKGYTVEKLKVIEENIDINNTGTSVSFIPDKSIWGEDVIDFSKLRKRIHQLAYLNPGLTFYLLIDDVDKDNKEIKVEELITYKNGLVDYVNKLTSKKTKVLSILGTSNTINNIDVQIAMTYTDAYNEEIYTFCNNVTTVDHGDHLTGYRNGLHKAIKDYIESHKINLSFDSDDLKEGLVGLVSVKVDDPIFEGQAKSKLKMTEVRNAVRATTEQLIKDFLDKNPEEAKALLKKIESAASARAAAQKARDNIRAKKELVEGGIPEKLADCTSKDPTECEIYIVEGDSAGGSAKQGRDRRFQAILPVFGKIINVEKKRFNSVINNEKTKMFVKALKCNIDKDYNKEKLRYHKIIIMTDADVDGSHILTLWITFIYRYLRPLIEEGHVYIACPPLYKLTYGKSKKVLYAYDDRELEKLKSIHGNPDNIQRYKGLGEMNADQLWETTMNPKTRKLYKITIEDAEAAEESISLCMGEDVDPRRDFILENASFAKLDV